MFVVSMGLSGGFVWWLVCGVVGWVLVVVAL